MLKIPSKLEPVTRAERIAVGEKVEPESREELFQISARSARLGGDCIVTLSTEGGNLKADKTYEEIAAADESGQNVRLVYGTNRYYLAVCDEEKAKFTHVRWTGSKARLNSISILADDTIEEDMADFTPSSIPG